MRRSKTGSQGGGPSMFRSRETLGQTSLRQDDNAATQVVAFIVAGVITLTSIGVLLATTRTLGHDNEPVERAGQDVHAGSLADLLVGSPGVGWTSGADGLARLGLGAGNGSGLDTDHLATMRGGLFTTDPT